jgi:sugar/nucleoside kinase (ribokinase family)
MMGPATEMSGGSVANTVAGFANLGGSAAYIGKVRDDQLGRIFNHDMRSLGVDIRLPRAADGAPTARSHVRITADGQRTMQTYLGACLELGLRDISDETIGAPKAILLEGYVWDIAEGPALARKAIDIARGNGTAVALSLSDSFCVERHRDSFEEFVRDGVDIVVADEDEVNALVGATDFDDTLVALENYDNLFAITRSEKGSVVIHGDTRIAQRATPVATVVDTTGAGDAYCAGFLFGWAERPFARGLRALRHRVCNPRHPAARRTHRAGTAGRLRLALEPCRRPASGADRVPGRLHFLRVPDQVGVLGIGFRPVDARAPDDALDVFSGEPLNAAGRLAATIAPDNRVDIHVRREVFGQLFA